MQATTEDFLHSESVLVHDYYEDTLGLPTRGDLEALGGHCAEGAVRPGRGSQSDSRIRWYAATVSAPSTLRWATVRPLTCS